MSGECDAGEAFSNAVSTMVANCGVSGVTSRDSDVFCPAANLAALESYMTSHGWWPWGNFADEHGPCVRYMTWTAPVLYNWSVVVQLHAT